MLQEFTELDEKRYFVIDKEWIWRRNRNKITFFAEEKSKE